jgi:hypothetical protein
MNGILKPLRDHTVTLRPNVGRGGSGCTDLDWKQARVR